MKAIIWVQWFETSTNRRGDKQCFPLGRGERRMLTRTYRGFVMKLKKHRDEAEKTWHIYGLDGKLLFCHHLTTGEAERQIDHLVLEKQEAIKRQ